MTWSIARSFDHAYTPPGYSPENWRQMRGDCVAAIAKAEGVSQ
jgi:hypothetical protein